MTTRTSPLHARQPLRLPIGSDGADLPSLALCDAGMPQKLGIKGPDAESFLSEQGVDLPEATYDSRELADGGVVVRLGGDEFILESGIADSTVAEISSRLSSSAGRVFRVERQDATLLLIGELAIEVLAQTCGIDFGNRNARQLVLTRIAGVSCGVMPETVADHSAFRIWVDYTYTVYLWEVLAQICDDLGGQIISAASIYPEPA